MLRDNLEPAHINDEIGQIIASRKRNETSRDWEVKRNIPNFIKTNVLIKSIKKSLGKLLEIPNQDTSSHKDSIGRRRGFSQGKHLSDSEIASAGLRSFTTEKKINASFKAH